MKNWQPLVNIASLWSAGALILLCAVLLLLAPRWPGFEYWQLQSSVKAWSGYVLLAILLLMWLPAWLRRRFADARLEDSARIVQYSVLINIWHQWLGVLFLVVLLLHASGSMSFRVEPNSQN